MTILFSALIAVVILLHVTWILLVSGGGILALTGSLAKKPRVEALYLVVVSLTIINRLFDRDCWLTKAELFLRMKLTGESLRYGFIEHYLSVMNIHLKDGLLFFVGAVWITAGLCAVVYYEVIGQRQDRSAVGGLEV